MLREKRVKANEWQQNQLGKCLFGSSALCWQHHLHISLRRIINISVDNLFFVLRFSHLRVDFGRLCDKKLAFNLTWQLLRRHFALLNKSTICWSTSGKFQLICKCDWDSGFCCISSGVFGQRTLWAFNSVTFYNKLCIIEEFVGQSHVGS